MAAPKNVPVPLIDEKARWIHFTSPDGGKTWKEAGVILLADAKNAERAVWSGSIRQNAKGEFWAAYTSLIGKRKTMQGIGLAFWSDSKKKLIQLPKLLLDPRRDFEALKQKGYAMEDFENLGKGLERDNTVMALRDPYIYGDDPKQAKVYFAAKAQNSDGSFSPAIGRFTINKTSSGYEAILEEPLRVPDEKKFKQVELPNVFDVAGQKYLLISTTNRLSQEQSDLDSDLHSRLYSFNENGELEALGRLKGFDIELYGAQVSWPEPNLLSSFFHRDASQPRQLSLPRVRRFRNKNK
ncbi:hypothetical protein GW915_11085 [bacterium]|nr:hypothetical protein [bacterium]